MPESRFLGRPQGRTSSMPDRMPGQGDCRPGFRPIPPYPGMPAGASPCAPIGLGIPEGGWTEMEPGYGPGYPPTGAAGLRALDDLLPTIAGAGRGDTASYLDSYAEWLRGMAGR